MTPNTGAYDEGLIATDVAALMDKTGGGILVTHSQGGGPGWHAAIKSANVRAVVSYEPGSGFVFPEDETPQAMQTISPFGALSANTIPPADFEKLTRIYNPQNEMFRHFKTKCSNLQNETYLCESFSPPPNAIKKHRRSMFFSVLFYSPIFWLSRKKSLTL